jgi:hypothetical protein
MANKKFWLGMLVMVLVFGTVVPACANQVDSSLNGTWIQQDDEDAEIRFNNGNFEALIGGAYCIKGTYTTGGGKLTFQITHFHGDFLGGVLESKWYSRNEFITALKPITGKNDEEIENFLDQVVLMISASTYSVSGNKLTTVTMDGETVIYTKKNG